VAVLGLSDKVRPYRSGFVMVIRRLLFFGGAVLFRRVVCVGNKIGRAGKDARGA
jgi:hypothetical protein